MSQYKTVSEKLNMLRNLMKKHKINAYIIPTNDFHSSEYANAYFKEREFMSGFTGSAGTLVVTEDFAGLWTDGRYFLQAANQLKGSTITLMKMGMEKVPTISAFLAETLKSGDTVGFDGRLLTNQFLSNCQKAFAKQEKTIGFKGDVDLVDEIWEERPALTFSNVWELSLSQSGKTRNDKLADLKKALKDKKAEAIFLSSLEDIAWLLNLRGNDIHDNPVFLSYFYMDSAEKILFAGFIENQKEETKEIIKHLQEDGIEIRSYFEAYEFARELKNKDLFLDESVLNSTLTDLLSKNNAVITGTNPTIIMKAIKNEVELSNMRNAHIKDGVAVTKFIYHMKKYREELYQHREVKEINADIESKEEKEIKKLTEIEVAEILLNLREKEEGFIEESFDPIMAFGEHGAIIHYSATEETNTFIENRSFLLSDTGGHYKDGTTDITRTISMARSCDLTLDEKKYYTLVLKSNLRLLNAKFPKGISGVTLDGVAREPLWEHGLDFNHGTGHGVGYILSVHEGPNAFRSPRSNQKLEMIPMVPGMITSDEPGLYFEGKYGIRLENLVECVADETKEGFYKFRALTYVPFDLDAVDVTYLNEEEIQILNTYHQEVLKKISPYLSKEESDWLKESTKSIEKS